ncbi:MAG TPA: hypothetical protein VM509_12040, partial [Planctomycetota bacterium]|nr:hypothetical protein [Planctomycetota bacterium]
MSATAVRRRRPGGGFVRRLAPALLLAPGVTFATAQALAPQKPAPLAAPSKPPERDHLFVRGRQDGALEQLDGVIRSDGLDTVTVQIAGRDSQLDSDLVVRIVWGEVPQSY